MQINPSDFSGTRQVRQDAKYKFIEKEGHSYIIAIQYFKHHVTWQLWQGIQALFMTVITIGFALRRSEIVDKWEAGFSGLEKRFNVGRVPLFEDNAKEINMLGISILDTMSRNEADEKLEILEFIDHVRDSNLNDDDLNQLEDEIKRACHYQELIHDPQERRTLVYAGEALARRFDLLKKEKKADQIRAMVADKLADKADKRKISFVVFLEQLRYHPKTCEHFDSMPEFHDALQSASELEKEDKELLFFASEKRAEKYEAEKQFDQADNLRVKAAKLVSPEVSLKVIEAKRFQARLEHDSEGIQLEELEAGLRLLAETHFTLKPGAIQDLLGLVKKASSNLTVKKALKLRLIAAKTLQDLASMKDYKLFVVETLKFSDIASYQDKEALWDISEDCVRKFEAGKDFQTAQQMRTDAAALLLSDADKERLPLLNLLGKFKYAPDDISKAEYIANWDTIVTSLHHPLIDKEYQLETFINLFSMIADHLFKSQETEKALAVYVNAMRMLDPSIRQDERFIANIEKISDQILPLAKKLSDSSAKTTFFSLVDQLSQVLLTKGEVQKAITLRTQAAQAIGLSSPLSDLPQQLTHSNTKFGLHLYPIDTSVFKNHTAALQWRTFNDGSSCLHAEAKIMKPSVYDIEKFIACAKNSPGEIIKALPGGLCSKISVTEGNLSFLTRETSSEEKTFEGHFNKDAKNTGYEINDCRLQILNFEGLGTVRVGIDKESYSTYKTISIDLDPTIPQEKAAEKLNLLFAIMGLGVFSGTPRKQDEERIKVLQLFRAFYPGKAYWFETSGYALSESPDRLIHDIIKEAPEMKEKF